MDIYDWMMTELLQMWMLKAIDWMQIVQLVLWHKLLLYF